MTGGETGGSSAMRATRPAHSCVADWWRSEGTTGCCTLLSTIAGTVVACGATGADAALWNKRGSLICLGIGGAQRHLPLRLHHASLSTFAYFLQRLRDVPRAPR